MQLGRAYRFVKLLKKADIPWVYHVTFLGNLSGIQSDGLHPSHSPNFGGGYAGHSEGKVFFTEEEGVAFWHSRLEQVGSNNTDWEDEESANWTPVVIRMAANKLRDAGRDPIGTRDALYDAYFMTQSVSPELMEVWDGNRWVDLTEADVEEMRNHILESSEYEQEEDAETGWWYMDTDALIPRD